MSFSAMLRHEVGFEAEEDDDDEEEEEEEQEEWKRVCEKQAAAAEMEREERVEAMGEEQMADERRENEASREENIMGIYPLERGKNGAIKNPNEMQGVGGIG